MEKILVSGCLCGLKVRYDGKAGSFPLLEKLKKHYEIVPFCPEIEGGLSIPRPRAEIVRSEVVTEEGKNVTKAYNLGAEKALNLCRFLGIKIAILNDKSPSCGSRFIHDGSFKNNVIEGLGVTARYLIANGIKVYSDKDALEFLIPEEEKQKKRTSHHITQKKSYKKTFKKDEGEGEEKPKAKRSFKKDTFKEEKPFRKPRFKKDESGEEKKSFRKDFKKKPYHKDAEDKSFARKGDKKPYGKKSFGDKKKPFGDKKKSFGDKKPFGKKPFGKKDGAHSRGPKAGFKRSK